MDVSERISHGNPSGLDARIASSFLPVYFEKDAGMANLPVELSAFLIVGDTGKVGDTLSAVSNVSRLIKKVPSKSKKAIKKLGTLAQETKEALINNDPSLIGRYMTKAHSYLSQLQVSSPSLDRLSTGGYRKKCSSYCPGTQRSRGLKYMDIFIRDRRKKCLKNAK